MRKSVKKARSKGAEPDDLSLLSMAIHRWSYENRINYGLIFPAIQTAAMAEDAYELAVRFRKGDLREALPQRPPHGEWLQLYEDPGRVWSKVYEFVRQDMGQHAAPIVLADDLAEVVVSGDHVGPKKSGKGATKQRKSTNQQLRREWLKGQRKWWKAYMATLADLRKDLQGEGRPPVTKAELDKLPVEFHFFLAVVLPCFVEYETSPWHLYRRATRTNREQSVAVEKLVRLDGSTIYAPKVSAWLHAGKHWRQQDLAAWLNKRVQGKLSPLSIKQSFAGLISHLGQVLGARIVAGGKVERFELTANQIMGLFDSVAKDRKRVPGATGNDAHLDPVNLWGWKKSIQRNRRVWRRAMGLWGVDKKDRG